MGPRTSGAVFWARLCPWPIFGTQRPPAKYGAIPSPADELRPRPPPRLYPTRFLAIFPLASVGAPTFGRSFLGAAVPMAYFWHTEAPRKVWPHSESGGRTWPAPPPKAIAHPFFGHFCGGRTWGRELIFWHGSGHGLFLVHGGPSQSLAPFRVRQTNMASPSPQGYSPPIFWAFLRRTNLGTGPSGAYFWARQCPRPVFGTRRPHAKSGPIPSPADELGQPLPPRL